ncbi:deoxyribose-phosphate aldolase [Candidatus Woesearchaeota archaeon CG11_big_fil_rev_8_21_14_0_20_43_8]|nr:MAG: deoxyribose-phosphate aldolase [Candidatus Woesearchaeota archaeon CG11_big_fil_rev_8_21_14_0_20_43_8]PIO04918.1 MAG: deoxyribose-phosphate aldolase [Candidatus Woesearchaeota archaeon CG08_land_8_20_14_0_20_43_7]
MSKKIPGRIRKEDIAGMIDHTILGPTATKANIKKICEEAKRFNFCSVCVNPAHVKFVKNELAGTNIKVCTVIGFPLGATTPKEKAEDTKLAIQDGADEIDMVMNIGAMIEGDYDTIRKEVSAVVKAGHGRIVKVILETAYLNDGQKRVACRIAKECKASFVKTSTGFGPHGATVHDIKLMRDIVGMKLGVKASGGIHTLKNARKMIRAGADRIGASSLVKEFYGISIQDQTLQKNILKRKVY